VASAKAADLRRFLSRHAKSNGIDADTLARLPLIAPESLQPLELPGPEAAALDRWLGACDLGDVPEQALARRLGGEVPADQTRRRQRGVTGQRGALGGARLHRREAELAHQIGSVALVTSDAHAGLVAAIGATLPGASWQRCNGRDLDRCLDG